MAQTRPPNKGDDSRLDDVHPVIVISVDKKGDNKKTGKKKRGSSRAARRLEYVEHRASDSLERVAKGVNRGVELYLEKRDKSERQRRDGAIVDFYENAAVGVAEAVAESTPVLTDIAKAFNSKKRRKQIRRLIRSFPVL